MTRLFLFLTVLIASTTAASAADNETKFRKLAEKIELPAAVRGGKQMTPAEYWQRLTDNDMLLAKFERDMLKHKGAENEAERDFMSMPPSIPTTTASSTPQCSRSPTHSWHRSDSPRENRRGSTSSATTTPKPTLP